MPAGRKFLKDEWKADGRGLQQLSEGSGWIDGRDFIAAGQDVIAVTPIGRIATLFVEAA